MATKREVVIGQRFGELTIIGRAPNRPNTGGCFVYVRCDCGHEGPVRLRALERGVSRCGRQSHWDRDMVAKGDAMAGQRFGALVVVRGTNERNSVKRGCMVWVRCDCGTEKAVIHSHLVRGQIGSCGGDAHRSLVIRSPSKWTRRQTNITYAIEAVGVDRIKIGVAADLRERLLKLQYPSPVELVVVASSSSNIERRLHAELAEYRLHGEWFRKTPQVMAAIGALLEPCRVSVLEEIGTGSRGKMQGRKYRCAKCGELGHFAKTCGRATQHTGTIDVQCDTDVASV